ncbi:Fe(3+)-hydroxamate ABC transporter permease FhuB [Rhizobium sullae]|uniref:Iron complex transport system permease protein n=1 Tax=Rhizobium sullae TaxID=50338 RepID=A0A4R3PYK0_RHISU|nr:Fe(3+)-hydroxamate ABC transporter permease FhuB [Rhizobium sullae]TCU03627.1 iron complex transport system permease protein [Rhizobium sullae]
MMVIDQPISAQRSGPWKLILLVTIPAIAAMVLTYVGAERLLPPASWWSALVDTDNAKSEELLFRHAFMPRVAVSILAGLGLGLSGILIQHLLRNPLAEPTTIGTNAGAGLALTVATLYIPAALENGRGAIALLGGALTTLLVFALAQRRQFSPVAVIVSGLVVSLTCGSASALLMAINREYTEDLFIWQSGSLIQNGDAVARTLLPQIAVCSVFAFMFLRPLRLLEAGDESAGSLGMRPAAIRLIGLSIAVAMSAFVVAAAGVISFIALAAPAFARIAGARTLLQRMVWSPLIAASQLWLVDQLIQFHFREMAFPAGAATALLGTPLLFIFLLHLKTVSLDSRDGTFTAIAPCGVPALLLLAVALVVTTGLAFFLGKGANGWGWIAATQIGELAELRLPRIGVALAAGAMFGVCGTLLQRMTTNSMAAPEVIGVSGGASLGVLALFVVTSSIDRLSLAAAASFGAFATLALVLSIAGRQRLSPEKLLLAGTSVTTLASALAALVLASGDPRTDFLLAWLSGSTYTATPGQAIATAVVALLLLSLAPLTVRWLAVLPLGETVSRSLGLGVVSVRAILLCLVAIPTAVATLAIGPLSFVGLMAPHLARMSGFRKPAAEIFASGLYGAIILIAADWAGRTIIFPWQIPAGLLTALAGGPFFLIAMSRSR